MFSAFCLLFRNMEVVMSASELNFEGYRRPDIDEVNNGHLNGLSLLLDWSCLRIPSVRGRA